MYEFLIEDGVRVSLHDECGEGWNGDYDPTDPDDVPLLRFDVDADKKVWEHYHSWKQTSGAPDEWSPVDDASYCTQLSANTTTHDQARAALRLIMQEVKAPLLSGKSIKRICEGLSWINSDALHEFAPEAFEAPKG